MKGFTRNSAPIINRLAEEFAVCDQWFSSIPGPTFPNRFFLYAGSSSGLASSQTTEMLAPAHVALGVRFENGTIFDKLGVKCLPWRVYHGDLFPTVLSLRGMAREFIDFTRNFFGLDHLESDLASADESYPVFTLIEPDYGRFWVDFTEGNSQHPLDSVEAGERLIKRVYEAVRNSPIWERSALVIVYDEHGGFYDDVVPSKVEPPGDKPYYIDANKEAEAKTFKYDWLGVRVPAIVVSPWVQRGIIDHTIRDHTSVIRTLCERHNLSGLTKRDKTALSLSNLFTLSTPRTDMVSV